jgi:homoserine kinase
VLTPIPLLRIRVPASTSNLGPGFDLLGLALSLYLDVEAKLLPGAGQHRVTRQGALAVEQWDSVDDLTLRAFEAVAEACGGAAHYEFIQSSEIPTGRGLGSSGAAIAAGLLLGQAASGSDISTQELISIGIEIEGHPDNVVASLLGGMTLCQPQSDPKRASLLQPDIHPSIGFSVVWPSMQLSTKQSRSVLPAQIPFEDAAKNSGQLAFLLEGLKTGKPEFLRTGELDRLHVPFRLGLIPGAQATLQAARECGAWLATISGSGSTLIALGPKDCIEEINQAMRAELSRHDEHVEARILEPVFGTPKVRID